MENQPNIGDQNVHPFGKNPVSQPAPVLDKPKTNFITIAVVVIVSSLIFGFGGYYLGKKSSNFQSYIATIPETSSPASSPNPTSFEVGSTNTLTAWKHSSGYWLLNLPPSWSAASFDGGPFSIIKIYAKTVSWDESHSGKDLSDIEAMTINIDLTDNELTTDNGFVWKEVSGEMRSNALILESQNGHLSFSISYPKNTNYKDQINEVLDNINFKASPEELNKAKIIP
jgi:hypothetical protein